MSAVPARLGALRPTLFPADDAARSAAPLAAVIAALVVAATVAVGMRTGPVIKPGQARLELHGATAQLASAGHPFRRATGTPTLRTGDRVKVIDGEPELVLPARSRAGLRAGSQVRVGAAGGPALHLERGDLLATGRYSVAATEATVDVSGVTKIAERAGLVAGSYDGSLVVRPADALPASVSRYRQVAVYGLGASPGSIEPLRVDDRDHWDRRILGGDVIDLDASLESFAIGFDAQLAPGAGSTAGFYRQLLPELAGNDISPDLIAGRSPGENLIGLTIASLDRGPFAERARRAFRFRDEGARWGLVAADRGVAPRAVLDGYQSALGRAGRSNTVALPRLGGPTATTTPGSTGPTGSTSPPPTTATTRPGTTTSTTIGPGTVTSTINNLVNILTGLLTTTTTRPAGAASQPAGKSLLGGFVPRIHASRR